MKLTQKALDALTLPDGKDEVICFDDAVPGLGLRLRRGGSRSWVFQFKIGDRHRRMSLGSASAIRLADARETARDLHAAVRLGRDPASEKAEGRVRAAETVAAVLRTYLPYQRTRLRPRSLVEIERHLLKHSLPLHGMSLAAITRRDIAGALSSVATTSGTVAANRLRASLGAFFQWCMREGLTGANPVIGTERRIERPRERVLSDSEIQALWAATDDGHRFSAVVRLLLLTGQRAGEIGGLMWTEIGEDRITLPAARTKNKRPHVVPITEPVRAILDAQPRRGDHVFGRRDRAFVSWSVSKEALDTRMRESGARIEHWTLHDLRRCCATRMADLGVQPHVIETLLNHVGGHKRGVAGIYNRSTYEREKRLALDMWGAHIEALVEGREPTVVALRA